MITDNFTSLLLIWILFLFLAWLLPRSSSSMLNKSGESEHSSLFWIVGKALSVWLENRIRCLITCLLNNLCNKIEKYTWSSILHILEEIHLCDCVLKLNQLLFPWRYHFYLKKLTDERNGDYWDMDICQMFSQNDIMSLFTQKLTVFIYIHYTIFKQKQNFGKFHVQILSPTPSGAFKHFSNEISSDTFAKVIF